MYQPNSELCNGVQDRGHVFASRRPPVECMRLQTNWLAADVTSIFGPSHRQAWMRVHAKLISTSAKFRANPIPVSFREFPKIFARFPAWIGLIPLQFRSFIMHVNATYLAVSAEACVHKINGFSRFSNASPSGNPSPPFPPPPFPPVAELVGKFSKNYLSISDISDCCISWEGEKKNFPPPAW